MAEDVRDRPGTPESPDVWISADVKVDHLRFRRTPETETTFRGNSGLMSVSGTERENLPRESEEGVVYRDVRVKLKIAGELADAGRFREQTNEERQNRRNA